jgi:hypothetical protein
MVLRGCPGSLTELCHQFVARVVYESPRAPRSASRRAPSSAARALVALSGTRATGSPTVASSRRGSAPPGRPWPAPDRILHEAHRRGLAARFHAQAPRDLLLGSSGVQADPRRSLAVAGSPELGRLGATGSLPRPRVRPVARYSARRSVLRDSSRETVDGVTPVPGDAPHRLPASTTQSNLLTLGEGQTPALEMPATPRADPALGQDPPAALDR